MQVSELTSRISTTATYQEIKNFVLEHYKLKVSTLNVAQVKEKYGIIEQENYNKSSKNHKVPKCTVKKENAIVKAFEHFNMI